MGRDDREVAQTRRPSPAPQAARAPSSGSGLEAWISTCVHRSQRRQPRSLAAGRSASAGAFGQGETDERLLGVAGPEGGGRAFGHNPPGGDHGDPVGKILGFLHVVGGEEDGLAEAAKPGDDVPGRTSGRGVEPGRRFVQEQQFGVADQSQGDIEAPPLPAR